METEEKPVLNRKKPFIEIRDRTMPNVAFQQIDNLFDRKGKFVKKADYAVTIKEPLPPPVKTRDIRQRSTRQDTPNKSVAKIVSLAEATRASKLAATIKAGALPQAVAEARKENARAAAAEAAVE